MEGNIFGRDDHPAKSEFNPFIGAKDRRLFVPQTIEKAISSLLV
jgi:hypothetical protein